MATRTLFFHISAAGQFLFYILSFASVSICFYGVWRRVQLWRQGRPFPPTAGLRIQLRHLVAQVLGHRRVRRRTLAGAMHLLIFYGLLALFVGTNIVAVEHYGALVFGEHWLYKGAFYLACKLTLDIFGLGLLVALIVALVRRATMRPPSVGNNWDDVAFLWLLLAATGSGFMLEAAGLSQEPGRATFAGFSPVGALIARTVHALVAAPGSYALLWWLHTPLVLAVIAVLPYGRRLHLFVAPATIALQPDRAMGVLEPLNMPEVEATGKVGLGSIADLDRWQLMSLDGCMECGRCTDACPATTVGKALDPKRVVLDLRAAMALGGHSRASNAAAEMRDRAGDTTVDDTSQPADDVAILSTDFISDDVLWACTNCHACVRECPALIRHVDILDGIRRYRVAEGRVSGPAATMLRQLTSRDNPWGLPGAQRADWARDLDITAAAVDDEREVLLWVGCAGAFESGAQKTTRALAALLKSAGVRFSILGSREKCTGDPARRTGDELQFQQLAEANIATLNSVAATLIVTQCPHCMHTIKNEYAQFGGQYEVMHHTQFLEGLVRDGRLAIPGRYRDSITFHDPCFLARVNGETEAPRALINSTVEGPHIEPERRESRTFCCGAGGGRMWMEEPPTQRPGVNRAAELIKTGAGTIAVGCPFCRSMLGDCVAQISGDKALPVLDIAEIMLAALNNAQASD